MYIPQSFHNCTPAKVCSVSTVQKAILAAAAQELHSEDTGADKACNLLCETQLQTNKNAEVFYKHIQIHTASNITLKHI